MPTSPDTPIVVGGCHRTGTSLVRRLLNAHSRVHCGPEVTFFRDLYGAYLTDPLNHLRFTTSARSLVPDEVLLEVLGAAFVTLHERAARAAGKSRWADKNPDNARYLRQWQELLGDSWTYVQVVRNPLDTLASMDEAGFPLTLPPDVEGRLRSYLHSTETGLDFVESHPQRSFLVVYEQLVADPAREVAGLMTRLGEAFEPAQLDFNRLPQVGGLEDPKIATTSGVHRQSLGRGLQQLGDADVHSVRAATADLSQRVRRMAASPMHLELW